MSIGPVVTRGYGLTSLPSSIANVVLRGYTAAEEVAMAAAEELEARQITIELEARHLGDIENLLARQITIDLSARHHGTIEFIARQIELELDSEK